MKDITSKPAEPLDLSQLDNISYSPHTLDLSPEAQRATQEKTAPAKPDRRQMNFFEYMPAAPATAHPDDEFGEKMDAWLVAANARLAAAWRWAAAAIAPLRMFWVVMGGIGLIAGLTIVAYLATHHNWAAVPFGSPAGAKQGDKNSVAPGKGAGNASGPTAMPAVGSVTTPLNGTNIPSSITSSSGGSSSGSKTAPAGTSSTTQAAPATSTGSGPASSSGSGSSSGTGSSSSGGTTNILPTLPLSTPVSLPLPTAPLPNTTTVTNKVL